MADSESEQDNCEEADDGSEPSGLVGCQTQGWKASSWECWKSEMSLREKTSMLETLDNFSDWMIQCVSTDKKNSR